MRRITKKWTTFDGTRIRICDMSDTHLVATINMLHRVKDADAFMALWFDGEAPRYGHDYFDPDDPMLDYLEAEWSIRKLKGITVPYSLKLAQLAFAPFQETLATTPKIRKLPKRRKPGHAKSR